MLASLLQLVIGLVTTIVGAMLLLRAWLYYWAVSSRHPLVEMSRRTTDWLVGPLSKIVPAKAGIDRASILGAFLTACVTVVRSYDFSRAASSPRRSASRLRLLRSFSAGRLK